MTPKRIALATILAPWVAPITIIVATTMYVRAWPYLGLFLVGLPVFNWLRKTQRDSLLILSACGAVGGLSS